LWRNNKYKKFGYLACNCRNKKEERKRISVPQNRYEMLLSKVIKCRVKIKRQEVEREEGKTVCCFKCRKERYQCRECSNRKEREKAAHVAMSQKVWQEEWRKSPEHVL